MKVALNCMHWSSQQVAPQTPASQALASSLPSPSSRRLSAAVSSHLVPRQALFGSKLVRGGSCEIPKGRRGGTLRRTISAGLDGFSDAEFGESIRELALRFRLEGSQGEEEGQPVGGSSSSSGHGESWWMEPQWSRTRPEPPYQLLSIERKANSLDLPLSLRILKKKNQWRDDFRDAGESAYCSVKKAFSSMVFIIRELHSYTLQMREFLFLEDVQGVLDRVQKEMNASFVWLFQQIFSHTPTLMMYVMILMANFTVYSMSSNAAIAAPSSVECYSATEIVSEKQQNPNPKLNQLKRFLDSTSSGKTISVGGNSGGGDTVKPVASGHDGGDGRFYATSPLHPNIVPDELSQLSSFGNPTTQDDESTRQVSIHDEAKLWQSFVEQASQMQSALMNECLDHETMNQFVSPIKAEIESDDQSEILRTELHYEQAISQDPTNTLLLCNYAQFLYLIVHDHDRAEVYFKRAKEVKPADAEAANKYANFLWLVRNDLEAAEESYLEATEINPENSHYHGTYAHFLWSNDGEDTCYPLG